MRLQESTEEDALAEGVTLLPAYRGLNALDAYRAWWAQQHSLSRFAWEQNPWTWAIEFSLLRVDC